MLNKCMAISINQKLLLQKYGYQYFCTVFNKKLDYFGILGVTVQATEEQIKNAYRNKAKQQHPDINPEFQERFKDINQAYRILSDPVLKLKYIKLRQDSVSNTQDNIKQGQSQDKIDDPIAQMIQTHRRYFQNKRKQSMNAHFSRQYNPKKHNKVSNKIEKEDLNKNSTGDKSIKVIFAISGMLTLVLVGQMVAKIYGKNKIITGKQIKQTEQAKIV